VLLHWTKPILTLLLRYREQSRANGKIEATEEGGLPVSDLRERDVSQVGNRFHLDLVLVLLVWCSDGRFGPQDAAQREQASCSWEDQEVGVREPQDREACLLQHGTQTGFRVAPLMLVEDVVVAPEPGESGRRDDDVS